MRIARIQISNFRNFRALDIALGAQAVIVGENKIGKSNLLYALRLVLDPALPDSARQLQFDDFWDRLERPLGPDDKITIAVDLTDFEDDENHAGLLAEHLIEGDIVRRINDCVRAMVGPSHAMMTNLAFSPTRSRAPSAVVETLHRQRYSRDRRGESRFAHLDVLESFATRLGNLL